VCKRGVCDDRRVIGLVFVGGLGAMWLLRVMADAIVRRGDARVADEAQAWLDHRDGA
jgi:hypothetical protein